MCYFAGKDPTDSLSLTNIFTYQIFFGPFGFTLHPTYHGVFKYVLFWKQDYLL